MATAEQGERAHELAQLIHEALDAERTSWVVLAGRLYGFHQARAWQTLGADSFTEWLGSPEVSLGRSRAYLLVAVWETFVVECNVPVGALFGLELSKFSHVVGPVHRGELVAEDALADVAALSRADLRVKYARLDAEDDGEEPELCPTCGRPM